MVLVGLVLAHRQVLVAVAGQAEHLVVINRLLNLLSVACTVAVVHVMGTLLVHNYRLAAAVEQSVLFGVRVERSHQQLQEMYNESLY